MKIKCKAMLQSLYVAVVCGDRSLLDSKRVGVRLLRAANQGGFGQLRRMFY